MEDQSFKRRFVKTFYDASLEVLTASKQWAPVNRNAKDRLAQLDKSVNEWLVELEALLISITPSVMVIDRSPTEREVITRYVVVYEPSVADDAELTVNASGQKLLPAVPLMEGAIAPAVEVTYEQEGTLRKAYAMAGVCGVPEGALLHPTDTEFAFVPLFSPDLDLLAYRDLFFNTERAHEHVRASAAA